MPCKPMVQYICPQGAFCQRITPQIGFKYRISIHWLMRLIDTASPIFWPRSFSAHNHVHVGRHLYCSIVHCVGEGGASVRDFQWVHDCFFACCLLFFLQMCVTFSFLSSSLHEFFSCTLTLHDIFFWEFFPPLSLFQWSSTLPPSGSL